MRYTAEFSFPSQSRVVQKSLGNIARAAPKIFRSSLFLLDYTNSVRAAPKNFVKNVSSMRSLFLMASVDCWLWWQVLVFLKLGAQRQKKNWGLLAQVSFFERSTRSAEEKMRLAESTLQPVIFSRTTLQWHLWYQWNHTRKEYWRVNSRPRWNTTLHCWNQWSYDRCWHWYTFGRFWSWCKLVSGT